MNIKYMFFIAMLGSGSYHYSAIAEEGEDSDIDLSANVALVSDYRFRGISLSNEDIAIQGGFDLTTRQGFSIGTWGSSIENFNGAELELDVYGGWTTDIAGTSVSFGAIGYLYPGGANTDYVELNTSVGRSFGVVEATLGAAYAPSQNNIGGTDNIYLYGDASAAIAKSRFSINGHLGFEDGAFGNNKLDWLLGISADISKFTLGIAYVDTNKAGGNADATVVITLGAAF